jgi:hypothetical protein
VLCAHGDNAGAWLALEAGLHRFTGVGHDAREKPRLRTPRSRGPVLTRPKGTLPLARSGRASRGRGPFCSRRTLSRRLVSWCGARFRGLQAEGSPNNGVVGDRNFLFGAPATRRAALGEAAGLGLRRGLLGGREDQLRPIPWVR